MLNVEQVKFAEVKDFQSGELGILHRGDSGMIALLTPSGSGPGCVLLNEARFQFAPVPLDPEQKVIILGKAVLRIDPFWSHRGAKAKPGDVMIRANDSGIFGLTERMDLAVMTTLSGSTLMINDYAGDRCFPAWEIGVLDGEDFARVLARSVDGSMT